MTTAILAMVLVMVDPFAPGYEWFSWGFSDSASMVFVKTRSGSVIYRPGQLWPGRES